MKKFIKIDKYGQLYIDKILFESYFPIIFTCLNDWKEIFICVCCQNNKNGCKWLLGKTSGRNIVQMLQDKITIRQLLLDISTEKISVDFISDEYKVSFGNSDWNEDSIYLPKKDSYMYAEAGEFEDEIKYFSSMGQVHYDEKYYKKISKALEMLNDGSETLTESFTTFISDIGKITIPSEVISTLEVVGKICANNTTQPEKYRKKEEYRMIFDGILNTTAEDRISIEVGEENSNYSNAA